MAFKIEVRSQQTVTKSGNAKASGKPYTIVEQELWLSFSDGQVRKAKIALADGAHPYALGEYTIDDASFFVNQYDGLELGRISLVPVVRAGVKAA